MERDDRPLIALAVREANRDRGSTPWPSCLAVDFCRYYAAQAAGFDNGSIARSGRCCASAPELPAGHRSGGRCAGCR